MSTIQDVARRAGVSTSTVSNVLNGRRDRMRPATLARVEAAIAGLKFQPSKLAQQLKSGQTPLLGLLIPSLTNPIYGYIAREIESVARDQFGNRMLIGSTYRDRDEERAFFEDLLSHGVRRVIVISSLVDEGHFEAAVTRGMAVMSYDRGATPGKRSGVGHVTPDNFAAAHMATRHLIAHGHRRLAFATVAGMTLSRLAKIEGFHAAVDEAGLRASSRVLHEGPINEYGDSLIADVGRAMALQIAASVHRPTGIVALNDLMALGLMAGLRDAGLRVPHDVSVVGIDGHFMGTLSNPQLTSVQVPIPDMAQAMVENVMRNRADPARQPEQLVFAPTRLIERESVARPPPAPRPRR